MKYSKQREEILKVVLNSSDHPNVNTIYERVRMVIPNISLGTVYRNLNTLYENKLIRKINQSLNFLEVLSSLTLLFTKIKFTLSLYFKITELY